jgi:hypothetical protein
MAKKKEPTVQELGNELFDLVEQDQGFAFISDGCGMGERDQFFRNVRNSLRRTMLSADKMQGFLLKYGELYEQD